MKTLVTTVTIFQTLWIFAANPVFACPHKGCEDPTTTYQFKYDSIGTVSPTPEKADAWASVPESEVNSPDGITSQSENYESIIPFAIRCDFFGEQFQPATNRTSSEVALIHYDHGDLHDVSPHTRTVEFGESSQARFVNYSFAYQNSPDLNLQYPMLHLFIWEDGLAPFSHSQYDVQTLRVGQTFRLQLRSINGNYELSCRMVGH